MKKTLTVFLILVVILLTGCNEKPLAKIQSDPIEIDMAEEFDPYSVFYEIQDGTDITYEIDEENSTVSFLVSKGDRKEEYKDIKVTLIYPEEILDPLTAPFKAIVLGDIEIHGDHSNNSNLAGYVRKDDVFEVYEVYQDGDDIWCRISSKHWINNKELSLLDLIAYDTNINFIKNVITYTDESLSTDRLSPWYDRYHGYVPVKIEDLCDDGECELDDEGRVVKWTSNELRGDYTEWIEYTYDNEGRRSHVISYFQEYGSWDYTYDNQNRIISEVYFSEVSSPIMNDTSYHETSYNEYDSNGNLIRITTDDSSLLEYYNTNIVVEYEYNGSLRFELVPADYQKRSFHIFRYNNEGNEIERFIAPDGDIRNPMPGYY